MHVAGTEDDEPEIVVADAMTSDPIIGTEALLHDGHGPGARPAVPTKAPAEMTPAQWEAHVLTHLPFFFFARGALLRHGTQAQLATSQVSRRRQDYSNACCRLRAHP